MMSEGNNNGDVDQDECIRINVALHNQGNSTATGIASVLSSSTPEVSVTQPNSGYLDIAPGTTGTNLQPFDVPLPQDSIAKVQILIFCSAVTTADGTYQFPFVVHREELDPHCNLI